MSEKSMTMKMLLSLAVSACQHWRAYDFNNSLESGGQSISSHATTSVSIVARMMELYVASGNHLALAAVIQLAYFALSRVDTETGWITQVQETDRRADTVMDEIFYLHLVCIERHIPTRGNDKGSIPPLGLLCRTRFRAVCSHAVAIMECHAPDHIALGHVPGPVCSAYARLREVATDASSLKRVLSDSVCLKYANTPSDDVIKTAYDWSKRLRAAMFVLQILAGGPGIGYDVSTLSDTSRYGQTNDPALLVAQFIAVDETVRTLRDKATDRLFETFQNVVAPIVQFLSVDAFKWAGAKFGTRHAYLVLQLVADVMKTVIKGDMHSSTKYAALCEKHTGILAEYPAPINLHRDVVKAVMDANVTSSELSQKLAGLPRASRRATSARSTSAARVEATGVVEIFVRIMAATMVNSSDATRVLDHQRAWESLPPYMRRMVHVCLGTDGDDEVDAFPVSLDNLNDTFTRIHARNTKYIQNEASFEDCPPTAQLCMFVRAAFVLERVESEPAQQLRQMTLTAIFALCFQYAWIFKEACARVNSSAIELFRMRLGHLTPHMRRAVYGAWQRTWEQVSACMHGVVFQGVASELIAPALDTYSACERAFDDLVAAVAMVRLFGDTPTEMSHDEMQLLYGLVVATTHPTRVTRLLRMLRAARSSLSLFPTDIVEVTDARDNLVQYAPMRSRVMVANIVDMFELRMQPRATVIATTAVDVCNALIGATAANLRAALKSIPHTKANGLPLLDVLIATNAKECTLILGQSVVLVLVHPRSNVDGTWDLTIV